MAKIESIKLITNRTKYSETEKESEITISTVLHFHSMDVRLQMEYQLHLFLVPASFKMLNTTFLSNWDEARMYEGGSPSSQVLEHLNNRVKATESSITTSTLIYLDPKVPDGIQVIGYLVPAISPATNWSNTYFYDLQLI